MSKTIKIFVFGFILLGEFEIARAHDLHIENTTIPLQTSCSTDHKLNFQYGNDQLCVPLTTTWIDNTLHTVFGGTTYSACKGECPGGGSTWVMPETPPNPVQVEDPSSCTWTQTNSKAYLLSDGNQYFDTRVKADPANDIVLTAEIVNGVSAPLFGVINTTSCYYDMIIYNSGVIYFRIGKTNSGQQLSNQYNTPIGRHVYKTERKKSTSLDKKLYVDDVFVTNKVVSKCSTIDANLLVFKSSMYASSMNLSQNGGMKLYNIKIYNSSQKLIHDYYPVKAGTDVCGITAETNAMWDSVDKKLYYPGGTGQMGYGEDP